VRNTDRIEKGRFSDAGDCTEFYAPEHNDDGKLVKLTSAEAMVYMRAGSYVWTRNQIDGTWFRMSLNLQTEYREAAEGLEEDRATAVVRTAN
jgi:hypothetical protein